MRCRCSFDRDPGGFIRSAIRRSDLDPLLEKAVEPLSAFFEVASTLWQRDLGSIVGGHGDSGEDFSGKGRSDGATCTVIYYFPYRVRRS